MHMIGRKDQKMDFRGVVVILPLTGLARTTSQKNLIVLGKVVLG